MCVWWKKCEGVYVCVCVCGQEWGKICRGGLVSFSLLSKERRFKERRWCGREGLTCPRTKPSLRKRMTLKMDKQQGIVTPKIIESFFFWPVWCVRVCRCEGVCVRGCVVFIK